MRLRETTYSTFMSKVKSLSAVLPPERHPLTLLRIEKTAEVLSAIERGEGVNCHELAEVLQHSYGGLPLMHLAGLAPGRDGYNVPASFASTSVRRYAESLAEDAEGAE